jgi:hypothetical protein
MATNYPNDYARRRYGELAAGFDRAVLLDLAAALARMDGDNAELARGMAAGLAELAQTKKNEG